VLPPGQHYIHNGGATALLAKIIANGSGKSFHQFTREALFEPIGAGPTEWLEYQTGEPYAASGLRMAPRDLARIGQIMLAGGAWGDKAGRSSGNVDFTVHDACRGHRRDAPVPVPLVPWELFVFPPRWARNRLQRSWSAIGNDGQRLYVFPDLQLCIAITEGNYDATNQSVPPTRIGREIVLPCVSRSQPVGERG
jgi:CubicO group peptidase (beta-lactamase class C family)